MIQIFNISPFKKYIFSISISNNVDTLIIIMFHNLYFNNPNMLLYKLYFQQKYR